MLNSTIYSHTKNCDCITCLASKVNANQQGTLLVEKVDAVNKPSHYRMGKIEVLAFILDQGLPYLAGNVIKYVCRYRFKGNAVQDLEKAEFYLKALITQVKSEPKTDT